MKAPEERKSIKIGFKVSPIEKEDIDNYLVKHGITMSEWMRKLLIADLYKDKDK